MLVEVPIWFVIIVLATTLISIYEVTHRPVENFCRYCPHCTQWTTYQRTKGEKDSASPL